MRRPAAEIFAFRSDEDEETLGGIKKAEEKFRNWLGSWPDR
jgi:hypothetical protein